MAQALITFLKNQYSERDGVEQPFFAGCFGIFGHGNIAGIGQALQQNPDFRYYQVRNEQAMVHTASAYAKVKDRLQTFVCTSSIGPGATNMVTGAALATINRLPVLLLPGDISPVAMLRLFYSSSNPPRPRISRSMTASNPSAATGTASTVRTSF